MDTEVRAWLIRPPTNHELELLATIAMISFVVALITIFVVVFYSGYLLVRTNLPGRIEAFVGTSMFAIFFGWTQFIGGDLVLTLGPMGVLLNAIVWSVCAVLFLIGHFRMLRRFRGSESHK